MFLEQLDIVRKTGVLIVLTYSTKSTLRPTQYTRPARSGDYHQQNMHSMIRQVIRTMQTIAR